MNLDEINQKCRDWFEDLTFGVVRAWKDAVPGRKPAPR